MDMKKTFMNKISRIFACTLALTCMLTGCGNGKSNGGSQTVESSDIQTTDDIGSTDEIDSNTDETTNSAGDSTEAMELEVCFGDKGKPFILHLYDNDTAAAIARHVGTADWRLPIYHYDDYDNWEVMQYYDIPERYDIPSNSENITSEKAGEVYYSEPNRIILFFGDAEVNGEYTKVGYFDYTDEFKSAVVDNPVLEGWGNKIVLINSVN